MENNNLENNIKDSFEQYLPHLDNDEIWDNIEPHLKKKKKRRFFYIWFFGGIALLGLTLINLFNINSSPIEYQQVNKDLESIVSSEAIKDPIATTSNTDAEIEKTIIKKEETSTTSKEIIKENYITPKNVSSAKVRSNVSDLLILENETLAFDDEIIRSAPVEESTILENKILEEKIEEKLSEPKITQDELPLEEKNIKGSKEAPEKTKKEKVKKKKGEKEKKAKTIEPFKNNLRWYIQPTASAIVPLKLLSPKAGFGESSYQKERKETERQLEAFSIGLNLQAQTRRGFVMMTGIEIQRLNGRMDFEEKTEEENIISNGIISVTEDNMGETIRVNTGQKPVTIRTKRTQRYFNHHTFINIPIGIGKFWHKPKYDLRLMTGLDINLYHNFRGVIKGQFGDLDMRHRESAVFDQVFKRRTGMGVWFATEFHKPVNKRFSWSIAPKIQLPLSKITQDDYVLRQKFINLSFTIGANYLILSTKDKKKKN